MNKYKYYTPEGLAKTLIQLLPIKNYKRVVDICCGSWNLLSAANEYYPNAEYTGVDVDKNAGEFAWDKARFFNKDGRKFALNENKNNNTYDLILSNPPFGYLKDSERLFVHNKNGIYYSGLLNKRYENEMTQANFLLSNNNSVYLFILPATFVEGSSNIKARCDISKIYKIKSLIKLPQDTFGSGRINTYAIIMEKGTDPNCNTDIYDAICRSGIWSMDKQKEISYSEIIRGNWNNEVNVDLASTTFKIYRGNISSSNFSDKGTKILHCSNKVSEGRWEPTERYYQNNNLQSKTAKKGDILVNRIGVKAGYWSVNEYNNIAVSDCIIVIRANKSNVLHLLERCSTNGRLNVSLRGVATRYININDIQLIIKNYMDQEVIS